MYLSLSLYHYFTLQLTTTDKLSFSCKVLSKITLSLSFLFTSGCSWSKILDLIHILWNFKVDWEENN